MTDQQHHHPYLDPLNEALSKARVATESSAVRALLTGELPLVELNTLKRSGVKLADVSDNPLIQLLYSDAQLADYERLRKAPAAFDPAQMVKQFPSSVASVEIPDILDMPRGYYYTPTDRGAMAFASDFNKGLFTGLPSTLTGYMKQAIIPATPILDNVRDRVKLAKSPRPAVVSAVDAVAGTGADDGFTKAPKPDPPKGMDRVKSTQVKNVPKRSVARKFLGAIPVLGAAIDVGMGVSDLTRSFTSVLSQDGEAGEHFQNALAHGGDALVGASLIGEGANIYANFQGHDGIVSLAESELTDD